MSQELAGFCQALLALAFGIGQLSQQFIQPRSDSSIPVPYGPIQCCLSMLVNVCQRPSQTQVNLQDDVDQNQQIPL